MTERRFHEGDTFSIPPMEYRLVQGKKSPDDLRLDWRWVGANGRSMWQPISLDQVAFIVDALADNENVLYPPPRYDGGARVLSFVRMAYRDGYERALASLHQERQNKANKDARLFEIESSQQTDAQH
jgi:hypothetical protein